jgi:hypothetical protein
MRTVSSHACQSGMRERDERRVGQTMYVLQLRGHVRELATAGS